MKHTEKTLFTPGPLSTSKTVKEAMLRDLGSRDREFIAIVRSVRDGLLHIAGTSTEAGYEAVLLQGSGTFGVEAMISSGVRHGGRLLVLANGAYGERMATIARIHQIDVVVLREAENVPISSAALERALAADPTISDVAMVHCETTTGIVNPVDALAPIVKESGRICMVDAMSSFAGMTVEPETWGIDYLVASANKCLQGVPGCSFVICQRQALQASAGRARSLSLDLEAQWSGLEKNGQFRFTPPTHVILALSQALAELEEEGGVSARSARYEHNQRCLLEGMRKLGFEPYLDPEHQSGIITSFHEPRHPRFDFEDFYERLSSRGFLIYPGKVANVSCFRIGTIGQLFEQDIRALLGGAKSALEDMGVALHSR